MIQQQQKIIIEKTKKTKTILKQIKTKIKNKNKQNNWSTNNQ